MRRLEAGRRLGRAAKRGRFSFFALVRTCSGRSLVYFIYFFFFYIFFWTPDAATSDAGAVRAAEFRRKNKKFLKSKFFNSLIRSVIANRWRHRHACTTVPHKGPAHVFLSDGPRVTRRTGQRAYAVVKTMKSVFIKLFFFFEMCLITPTGRRFHRRPRPADAVLILFDISVSVPGTLFFFVF